MRRAPVALVAALLLCGCDSESPQMKECLATCSSAEAQAAECSGPEAETCKKDITAAAEECRTLCKEHMK
jgi:hypothetical protein